MRTKRVHCKLYLEGIQVPFTSIQITEQINQPPVADISFPMKRLIVGLLPKTVAHVFYLDEGDQRGKGMVETDYKLIFRGELSGINFSIHADQQQINASFSGFTQNWKNHFVIPLDVSMTTIANQNFLSTSIMREDGTVESKMVQVYNTPVGGPLAVLTNKLASLRAAGGSSDGQYLAVAFKAFVDNIINQPVYLRALVAAFGISNSIHYYSSKSSENLLMKQAITKFLQGVTDGIGSNTPIADALLKILNTFGFDYIELATPSKTSKGIKNIFIKPNASYFTPPKCNLIFDDEISTLSYQRNYDNEPTRLMGQTTPFYMSDAEELSRYCISTVVPQNVMLMSAFVNDSEDGTTCSLKNVMTLTSEEQCRGVIPSSYADASGIEEAYLLEVYKAINNGEELDDPEAYKEKILNDPATMAATVKELQSRLSMTNNTATFSQQYHLMMSMIKFLEQRQQNRIASISSTYNPYRIVGVTGAVISDKFPTIIGTIAGIHSTISADGTAVQSITMTHCRVPGDLMSPLNSGVQNNTFDFMDDNFQNAPLWYKDFEDDLNSFYEPLTGKPDGALVNPKNKDYADLKTAIATIKKQKTDLQSYLLDKFEFEVCGRKLVSEKDVPELQGKIEEKTRTINKQLTMVDDVPTMDAKPFVIERQQRVKDIFKKMEF